METIKLTEPTVVEPPPKDPVPVSLSLDSKNLQPTTTKEEDQRTLGQRRVNLIWESTQALIAIFVTGATIWSAMRGVESLLLGNAFTLIIALYFVRQNHTKIGGIGGSDSR